MREMTEEEKEKDYKAEMVRELIEKNNLTPYAVHIGSRVSQPTIHRIIKKQGSAQISTLDALITYLEAGNFGKKNTSNVKTYVKNVRLSLHNQTKNNTAFVIPLSAVRGLQDVLFDQTHMSKLSTETFEVSKDYDQQVTFFKIEIGDQSMNDAPIDGRPSRDSICKGDWVYVTPISRAEWRQLQPNNRYCFFHSDRGIFIRLVEGYNADNGMLSLLSSNPDKEAFPDFELKMIECTHICKIIKISFEL